MFICKKYYLENKILITMGKNGCVTELKLNDSRSVFCPDTEYAFCFSVRGPVFEKIPYLRLCKFKLSLLFYANFRYINCQIELPFSDNDDWTICFR